jgi:hypothetical protein
MKGDSPHGFGVGLGPVPEKTQPHIQQVCALFGFGAQDDVAFF